MQKKDFLINKKFKRKFFVLFMLLFALPIFTFINKSEFVNAAIDSSLSFNDGSGLSSGGGSAYSVPREDGEGSGTQSDPYIISPADKVELDSSETTSSDIKMNFNDRGQGHPVFIHGLHGISNDNNSQLDIEFEYGQGSYMSSPGVHGMGSVPRTDSSNVNFMLVFFKANTADYNQKQETMYYKNKNENSVKSVPGYRIYIPFNFGQTQIKITLSKKKGWFSHNYLYRDFSIVDISVPEMNGSPDYSTDNGSSWKSLSGTIQDGVNSSGYLYAMVRFYVTSTRLNYRPDYPDSKNNLEAVSGLSNPSVTLREQNEYSAHYINEFEVRGYYYLHKNTSQNAEIKLAWQYEGRPSAFIKLTDYSIPDNEAPSVSASSNLTGWTASNSVNISINASDNDSGVNYVRIYRNGSSIWSTSVSNRSSYSDTVTINLESGENDIYVYAKDAEGNSKNSSHIYVYYDDNSPIAELTRNSDEYTNSRNISLTFKADDSLSGVAGWSIREDNVEVFKYGYSSDGYSTTITINDTRGWHEITLYVEDKVGHNKEVSFSVFYDPDPPESSISLDKSGWTGEGTVNVTISVEDTGVGIGYVAIRRNNEEIWTNTLSGQAKYSYTYNATLVDGENDFDLLVIDTLGNSDEGYGYETVYYDPNKPTISITIEENKWINYSEFDVNISALDNQSGLAYISISQNDNVVFEKNFSCTTTKYTDVYTSTLTAGENKFTMYAKDCVGNETNLNGYKTISYDNTSPTGSLVVKGNTEADAQYTNTLSVKAFVKWTDTYSGLDYIDFYDGDSKLRRVDITGMSHDDWWSLTLTDSIGWHTIYAYVYDNVGNKGTASYKIYYDNIAPKINSYSITGNKEAEDGYTNTKTLSVSISITDSNSGNKKINIEENDVNIGGITLKNRPSSYEYNATVELNNLDQGKHIIIIKVEDSAGNVTSISKNIIYDTIFPQYTYDLNPTTSNLHVGISDDNMDISEINPKYLDYYLSTRETSVASIDQWLPAYTNDKVLFNVPRGNINAYVRLNTNNYKDKAGNKLSDTDSYNFYNEGINDYTQLSMDNTKNLFLQDNGVLIVFSDQAIVLNINQIRKMLADSIILLGVENIDYLIKDFTYAYDSLICISPTTRKATIVDIVVVSVAPIVDNTSFFKNTNNIIKINKNEELTNFGVNFISPLGLDVYTNEVITLDGVKVDSIDTSKVGTYSIKTVAKDALGKRSTFTRTIIVEQNKEDIIVDEKIVPELFNEETKNIIKEEVKETNNINKNKLEERKIELYISNMKNNIKLNNLSVLFIKENTGFRIKLFVQTLFKIYDG